MVLNKRKKVSRMRGSHTHGWGAMKKHRGAGHRGGRGNAGTGKRGDAKKPCIWKDKNYFGKSGFTKKGKKRAIQVVDLAYFEDQRDILVQEKQIELQNSTYIIDGEKLGFDKVLGNGKITQKYRIIASAFSKGAIEKIKAAGGEAVILKPEKTEEKTKEEAQ